MMVLKEGEKRLSLFVSLSVFAVSSNDAPTSSTTTTLWRRVSCSLAPRPFASKTLPARSRHKRAQAQVKKNKPLPFPSRPVLGANRRRGHRVSLRLRAPTTGSKTSVLLLLLLLWTKGRRRPLLRRLGSACRPSDVSKEPARARAHEREREREREREKERERGRRSFRVECFQKF